MRLTCAPMKTNSWAYFRLENKRTATKQTNCKTYLETSTIFFYPTYFHMLKKRLTKYTQIIWANRSAELWPLDWLFHMVTAWRYNTVPHECLHWQLTLSDDAIQYHTNAITDSFNVVVASLWATDRWEVLSYPSLWLKEVRNGHFTAGGGGTAREEDQREGGRCAGSFPWGEGCQLW